MDRLTNDGNIAQVMRDPVLAMRCFFRLQDYENTGLEPAQIVRLQKENERRKRILQSAAREGKG